MKMTEREICEEIIKLDNCPVIFVKNGVAFAGCNYCPFSNTKDNELHCVNYSFWDNHVEVVKQAKDFLEGDENDINWLQ